MANLLLQFYATTKGYAVLWITSPQSLITKLLKHSQNIVKSFYMFVFIKTADFIQLKYQNS
jgi:hypothetical protein